MKNLRRIVLALAPPILIDLARALRASLRSLASRAAGNGRPTDSVGRRSVFTAREFNAIVARMDAGDYDFDDETVKKMIRQWRLDNAAAPYPTRLSQAYARGDAVSFNSREMMGITYRLPYSHAYEDSQQEKYATLVEMIAGHGVTFTGAVVVDVGCGYGGLLNVVWQRHPTAVLYGVECSESAIDWIARNRPHMKGIVADVEAPTEIFQSACCVRADVVLCTEVLEHLVNPERAVENLMLLAPGGTVVLTVPNGRPDTAPQHINFWSPESWHHFIERVVGDRWMVVDRCSSPNSPGGFDNMAIIRRAGRSS